MSAGEKKRGLLGGLAARASGLAAGAARAALSGAGEAERLALTILKDRLDRLDYPPPVALRERPADSEPQDRASSRQPPLIAVMQAKPRQAAELLRELLDRSVDQSDEQARECLDAQVLQLLVPDQARMLSALSEGTAYPVIQVQRVAALGRSGPAVLENHSNLGKKAGICLHSQAPRYIGQLRALGLVEEGPEDAAQKMAYELLESEDSLRSVVAEISARFGERARLLRGSLKISRYGSELWERCMRPTTIEQSAADSSIEKISHLP